MKKGFTLIELLAVLIVLGVIGVIVIPITQNLLNKYRKTMLDVEIRNIEDAARDWGADNVYMLPKGDDLSVVKEYYENGYEEDYGVLIITLDLIQKKGYIKKNIKNPVTQKEISPDTQIYITNKTNKMEYKVKMG